MNQLKSLTLFLASFALCSVPVTAVQAGECELCVQIVSAVEEYVAAGLTPDEILAEIEGLCEGLGLLQGICESLIENNLKPILDNLEDQLSPRHVCQIIGFCDEGTTPSPEPRKYQVSIWISLKPYLRLFQKNGSTLKQCWRVDES